jgi:HEPN domain-containing protein
MKGKRKEAIKSAWEDAQTSLLFLHQGLCGESCLKSFEAVRKILRAFYQRDDTFFVNEHSLIEMCFFLPHDLREKIYREVLFLEKYRWLKNFPFIRELVGGEPDVDEARKARNSALKVLEIFTEGLGRSS